MCLLHILKSAFERVQRRNFIRVNCKINSLKIYNRDLTEQEIQKTYEQDYERYNWNI